MAQIGSMVIDLIAETASFNANVQKAARELSSQSAQMNRSLAKIGAGIEGLNAKAALLRDLWVGSEIVGAANRALDYASSLGEMAQQVGVTAEELQTFRYMATQVGISQQEMDGGLQKLTRTLGQAQLGSKSAVETFAVLGVSIRDAGGQFRTAGEIMPDLARALSAIPDPARRAALEVELFGRAGQKLDPLLAGGSAAMAAMQQRARELGLVLSDELVAKADEAADKVAEMRQQLEVNFASVVASNADSIMGLAGALQTLTVKAAAFVAEWPRLSGALAGAAAGARLGPWGAAAGAAIGGVVGGQIAGESDAANNDLGFRMGEVKKWQEKLRTYRRTRNISAMPLATKQLMLETSRLKRALGARGSAAGGAAGGASAPEAPELDALGAAGGGGARRKAGGGGGASAAQRVTEQYEQQKRVLEQQIELLGLRAQGMNDEADSLEARYQIERQFPGLDRERLQTLLGLEQSLERQKRSAEELSRWIEMRAGSGEIEMSPEMQARQAADFGDALEQLGIRSQKTSETIKVGWQEAADGLLYSLERMTSGIRGGGFLDILGGVTDLFLQLGSLGLFGGKMQANIRGARAKGGPVYPGGPYLVGEKGPELFWPTSAGQIVANDNLGAAYPSARATGARVAQAEMQPVRLVVEASPWFDARVDSRSAQIAAPMAAQAGVASTQVTERRLARRARNRLD